MARTAETAVKAAIKKRLEYYGVLPFVKAADAKGAVNGTYWPAVAGPMSVHGIHDFCGVWDGFFFSMEAKAPDNKQDATEPQRAFMQAIRKAGGISLIGVRSADAVDALYQMIQEKKQCSSTACPTPTTTGSPPTSGSLTLDLRSRRGTD